MPNVDLALVAGFDFRGTLKLEEDLLRSIDTREASIALGIVVEKRKSSHPWADWSWKPVAVICNPPDDQPWSEMVSGDGYIQFHAATLQLVLHRKETEALKLNLMLDQPELYVILRNSEDLEADFPYEPHLVTASSFDAQDYTDAGDDIVEKVVMPEPIAAFVQAFVEEHHVEEEFIKRRRDRLNVEEQKFGKSPIFQTHTKH